MADGLVFVACAARCAHGAQQLALRIADQRRTDLLDEAALADGHANLAIGYGPDLLENTPPAVVCLRGQVYKLFGRGEMSLSKPLDDEPLAA